MSFTIREATNRDIQSILELVTELCAYEGKTADQVELNEEVLLREGFRKTPTFTCLLTEVDGTPMGYCIYSLRFSAWRGTSVLYIEDIYIQEQHRKKGYGKAMLKHLADIAVERKCKFIEGVAYDWNDSAMVMYKKLGAIPQKQLVLFRWDTDNYNKL